jgi:hypothetical protein
MRFQFNLISSRFSGGNAVVAEADARSVILQQPLDVIELELRP